MYHYVDDKEFLGRMKRLCSDIVNQLVQKINREEKLQVRADLVGSGAKNLITQNANNPIDLDYNLEILKSYEYEIYDGRSLKKYIGELLLSNEIDAPFDLEKVANALSYSPNYLCRIFKRSTGETMLQYYYRLKINRAQSMILETPMSLKEISESLGFDTVQYFSAVFKKYAGVTPSQYKNAVIK